MTNAYKYPTEYFLEEGKENLERCLLATFEAAVSHSIKKVIIFTAAGKGVTMALQNYRTQEKFADIELIAVTFPNQTQFSTDDPSEYTIPDYACEFFAAQKVPIVRAHLPFDPIRPHYAGHGVLGQDFSLIGNALRIFCGSMSLCVQAVLMASDAGHASLGEHVIAMTSDTSILVRAAGTSKFLTDLIVREVICKPVLLTIGKSEKAEQILEDSKEEPPTSPELLPPE
jgi:uncharacterized protein